MPTALFLGLLFILRPSRGFVTAALQASRPLAHINGLSIANVAASSHSYDLTPTLFT